MDEYQQFDILIIGGGLTGATLMLALKSLGYKTLLVEAKPFSDRTKPDFDARTLALSPASIRILEMLNVWSALQEEATPIETIHVSERRSFGNARLQGEAHQALGYVVEMQHINQALHPLLEEKSLLAPAQLIALDPTQNKVIIRGPEKEYKVKASLIVAADGAESTVRRLCGLDVASKEYGQQAIVANIGLARAHHHIAYERFTASGPLALLPMRGLRVSLVWSLSPEEAQRLMTYSDREFLKNLQQTFGYRLGRFTKVGQRMLYPLKQVTMNQHVFSSIVFVGNAAQTLHPVAGQGFNLGLRDIAMLAQCIAKHGLNNTMLQAYQKARTHDQVAVTRFTDGLVELFTSHLPGLSIARGAGLIAFNNSSILKKILMRYTRGFAGVIPDLVCGIPLQNGELS